VTPKKTAVSSARFYQSAGREPKSDRHTGSRSLSNQATAKEGKQVVFAPRKQGYNSRKGAEQGQEHLVCVTRPEGQRVLRAFSQPTEGQQPARSLAFKHPEASIFCFDQVINENHAGASRSRARTGQRSKSRLSLTTSRDSKRWTEPHQHRPGFYHHSLVRDLLLKTLEQGRASSTQVPQPANFCYVQVNTLPSEPARSKDSCMPSSASKPKALRNFGRFLSLKGIEEGTNVAFLAVRDILAH
jgi:hypothetical protein